MTETAERSLTDRVKRGLHLGVARAERAYDRVAHRLRRRFDRYEAELHPYRGFGGPGGAVVWGRVMNDTGVSEALDTDTTWDNVKAMARRFNTREIPHVALDVEAGGEHYPAQTDEEGYFRVDLPAAPAGWEGWSTARVEVAGPDRVEYGEASAEAPVMVPSPAARFGIVSDIDDTVLPSGATRLVDLIRTTVTNNAHTRAPFEGVATFYAALTAGEAGPATNPIYYVSSSPWNLYDFLLEFMDVHGLPKGPILLRDLGLDNNRFIKGSHRRHKLTQLETVFLTVPDLPFVLVGDSGQRDPEIYAEAVRTYPGRIRAIYLRDLGVPARRQEVETIFGSFGEPVPMLHTSDTAVAAHHAAEMGLIG